MGLFGRKNREAPQALQIPPSQPMYVPNGGININGKIYTNKYIKKEESKKCKPPIPEAKEYGVYPPGASSYFNAQKSNIRSSEMPPPAPRNNTKPCMCDKCVSARFRNGDSEVPMSRDHKQ